MADQFYGQSSEDQDEIVSQDTLTIVFEGLDADKGEMPLDDFLTSLAGWRDFVDMTSSMFFKGKLTLLRDPNDVRLDIRIARVRRGSVWVDLILPVVLAATGELIAIKADKLATAKNMKKLWRWVGNLFTFYVEQKKTFRTKDEIVAALESLAQQHDIAVDREHPESQRVVTYTDECLKSATVPVEKSATMVTLKNNDVNIVVDADASRAIKSGFILGTKDDVYLPAVVKVRELNLDTGHTRLEVLQSQNEEFVSRLDKVYIEDAALKEPGNPYSQSLDTHVSIDVYVARTVDKATGDTIRWRIKTILPGRDLPLLNGTDGAIQNTRPRPRLPDAKVRVLTSASKKSPRTREPRSR